MFKYERVISFHLNEIPQISSHNIMALHLYEISYCQYVIPQGVIRIYEGAFSNCLDQQSIKIPNSVTEIEPGAFSDCKDLQLIEVAVDNLNFKSCNNCLLSKDGKILIRGCKTSIIPNSVTEIGDRAFSGCSGLQSIEIPNSVTKIGWRAFEGCGSLKDLILHKDYTTNNGSHGLVENLPLSNSVTLHVPIGTGYAYRHDDRFSKVKEVIVDVR